MVFTIKHTFDTLSIVRDWEHACARELMWNITHLPILSPTFPCFEF